uniref:Major facilitator superfamily (MFS) profile domain-containing protein n=1 Tax=Parascaris univalens TaxID=6257 RepID=A0A914ZX81_PARUN
MAGIAPNMGDKFSSQNTAKGAIAVIPSYAVPAVNFEKLSFEAIGHEGQNAEAGARMDDALQPGNSSSITADAAAPAVDIGDLMTMRNDDADFEEPSEEGCTYGLLVAVLAIVIGSSFQAGYQFGWIISSRQVIEEFIRESSFVDNDRRFKEARHWIWTSTISSYEIGGIFGSLAAASFADKHGRKSTLFFNNVWAAIATVLMTASYTTRTWYLMLLARFIFGFNAGVSLVVVPVYLTELSPNNLRGAVGTSHQLFFSLAVLIANVFSFKHVFGTAERWHHINEMGFLPIVAQLILLKFCPESPHFLTLYDDDSDEAEAALAVLRGKSEVQAEVMAIRGEISKSEDQPRPMLGAVFSANLRWATALSVFIMLMRQLSGMDVVLECILDVITAIGFTTLDGQWTLCGLVLLCVCVTALSALLVDSSYFGRRTLLLIGIFGMFFSSVAVILALILIENRISTKQCRLSGIFFATVYTISYALGPGSIPWFYVTELYTTSARTNGMSFACTVSWTVDIALTLLFPLARERFSNYSFLLFVFPLFASGIFSLVYVIETKGKSISNIQADLEENRPSCL